MTQASVGAFVTSSTVRAAKDKLDPYVRSLDRDVVSCTTMADQDKFAWSLWLRAWDVFYRAKEGFWTAGAEMDQVDNYERQFKQWEELVRARCGRTTAPDYLGHTDQATPPLATPGFWLAVGGATLAAGALVYLIRAPQLPSASTIVVRSPVRAARDRRGRR